MAEEHASETPAKIRVWKALSQVTWRELRELRFIRYGEMALGAFFLLIYGAKDGGRRAHIQLWWPSAGAELTQPRSS